MKRSSVLGFTAVLLALLVFATASAQPYGSDLLVSHYNGRIYRVNPSGKITTVGNYGPDSLWKITWDVDNRHLLAVANYPSSMSGYLLRIDPRTGTATTLMWNTGLVATIAFDQNGDYLFGTQTAVNAVSLLRVKRHTTTFITIRTGFPFAPAFLRERSTGDWLLSSPSNAIQRYTPDFSRVIASAPHVYGYTYEMVQDPHRLDVYVGASDFCRFDPASNKVTSISLNVSLNIGARGVALDRSPGTRGGMVYVNDSTPSASHIYRFDRNNQMLATLATLPTRVTNMLFDRSRNLATILKAPPNDREIRLSFPGDGGKAYAVAIGISGYTMGLSLPDGRMIPLTLDSLAGVTAQRPLPPFLTGNHGYLNPAGEAVARLNLNPLGRSIRGLPLWAVAVVIDPAAPFGISTISKPMMVMLE